MSSTQRIQLQQLLLPILTGRNVQRGLQCSLCLSRASRARSCAVGGAPRGGSCCVVSLSRVSLRNRPLPPLLQSFHSATRELTVRRVPFVVLFLLHLEWGVKWIAIGTQRGQCHRGPRLAHLRELSDLAISAGPADETRAATNTRPRIPVVTSGTLWNWGSAAVAGPALRFE